MRLRSGVRRTVRASIALLGMFLSGCGSDSLPSGRVTAADPAQDWLQWGREPGHGGALLTARGQEPLRILAEVVLDPFTAAEKAETDGVLGPHYAAPLLVGGRDVFVTVKSGRFVSCDPPGSRQPFPCGPDAWDAQTWNVKRLTWEGDRLVERWTFASDWKPVPDAGFLRGREPVFHAVVVNDHVVVPGAGGSVHEVDRESGRGRARLTPFGGVPVDTFVAGPLVADAGGAVYYHALQLDMGGEPSRPWNRHVLGGWLVRVGADRVLARASFGALVPGAPAADAACEGTFTTAQLPWPPAPDARPAPITCGAQRPGLNVAPALAPDGTIYTVSRAHFGPREAFLIAINPNLTPRWAASLRGRLADGCDVLLPQSGTPGGCRAGAPRGVDPATNALPAGQVNDTSTSSPVVAPDGSVLYGALTTYNWVRGHLMRFSARGQFLSAYDFGWDVTPAVWPHDGTFSVIIKDNRYPVGSYCRDPVHCPTQRERYDVTQLSAGLVPEWRFTVTNTQSCRRGPGGVLTCVDDHPDGFEWCINAPAVDAEGVVYGNAEDGRLYALEQGGRLRRSLFLDEALGAAYTPVSLDREGRVYAQNNGRLFVLGR